jgi:hypothetical protein
LSGQLLKETNLPSVNRLIAMSVYGLQSFP